MSSFSANPLVARLGPTVAAAGATVAALAALAEGAYPAAALAGGAAGVLLLVRPDQTNISLTGSELDELRQAELSLAGADDTHEAARQLAEHALTLLGARSAVVLIEGIGDTVRVSAGPSTTEDVYGSGSRMRLLDDAGVPCGSIAVSARADGRAYTARHERILDALAERVSGTLHRLSLLTEVSAERRTLAELIGASSDGIFSVGSDLRVKSWNPAMARITGVAGDVALGRHVNESFRPADTNGTPAVGKADPGRAGQTVDAALLQLDVGDEIRWLTCSYAPLSDGGYVVIARDDTERKKIQDDKDGWIAQVSHELRTPLTPIKGFLSTLARRDAQMSPEDRATIYELLLREEARLENLVEQLLRTTQLEQGGFVVQVEDVDWPTRVAEQVDSASRHDPSRVIEVEVDPAVGLARTDPAVAMSVLTNLLSNAVKYAVVDSTIEVVVTAENDEIITKVIDHGPGIPRSDRTRIFEKFTRLGSHLTRPQQGVGLGLHIAKRSVEHLDGRIWVEDTPGGGSTFCFSLPAASRATGAGADGSAGGRTRRAPLRSRESRPVRR